MALPAWPTGVNGVPQSADIDSLQENDQDMLVRYKTDYGVEKLRQRSTMVIGLIQYTKTMTTTQWDALQSFYRLTLGNGSSAFTTIHPRTQAAITAQFTTMPTMQSIADSNKYVKVGIQLTVLPVNAS